jgi:hypothetical protein
MSDEQAPEQFVVVSFSDDQSVFVVTRTDGSIVLREYDAVKNDVHGVLSTEDEIDNARDNVRYAVPADLAREYFGWDL